MYLKTKTNSRGKTVILIGLDYEPFCEDRQSCNFNPRSLGLSFYHTSLTELDKRHFIIDSLIINLISDIVIRTYSHYCIIQFTIRIFVYKFLVVIRFEFDSLKYKVAP